MSWSRADHGYMARALQLARRGLYTTDPNPRVGCVLVREDRIIAEGWHERAGGPHAEIVALQQCPDAAGSSCYLTLEPCAHHGRTPPCVDSLIRAGIREVVVASEDPNPAVASRGLSRLREAGIHTRTGLLADTAAALNPGFLKRMRTGMPYVRSKLAMSLDGRTALANGDSRWITSVPARRDAHRLRARSSAILTGIGTVLADDPQLTARSGDEPLPRQPLRVIMDTGLRLPLTARLLHQPGQVVVISGTANTHAIAAMQQAGVQVKCLDLESPQQLPVALQWLASEHEVNEVLVEAGPVLNGALLQAGLLDELVIYLAPALLGDAARGLFALPVLERMQARRELEIIDVRPVGRDWRIQAIPRDKAAV